MVPPIVIQCIAGTDRCCGPAKMIPHTKGFYSLFFKIIFSETGCPQEQALLRSLLILAIKGQHKVFTVILQNLKTVRHFLRVN